jgi:hypothetical protein
MLSTGDPLSKLAEMYVLTISGICRRINFAYDSKDTGEAETFEPSTRAICKHGGAQLIDCLCFGKSQ